ncbi:hypothetical protein ABZ990_25950 [Streptomyces sp. NPDC046203]|uniref:Rv1733c family protein n=1 Tax=Streptomyces sp. NPDC046203 TaxID=3154602 RepID=UPI0033FE2245
MRAATGLWRWRHNPLRRTTDLIEAWVALTAAVLLCLGAPLAGWTVGTAADTSLRREAKTQARERFSTVARVVSVTDRRAEGPAAADPVEEHRPRPAVVAVWTAPDGTPRSGTLATSRQQARPGVTFLLWTDRSGRIAAPPMLPSVARAHALITGFTVALFAGILVETARRLAVRLLLRRRYARLDRAWAEAGPDWGRTGTGS